MAQHIGPLIHGLTLTNHYSNPFIIVDNLSAWQRYVQKSKEKIGRLLPTRPCGLIVGFCPKPEEEYQVQCNFYNTYIQRYPQNLKLKTSKQL